MPMIADCPWGDCVRFLAMNRAAVAGNLVCGHQPLNAEVVRVLIWILVKQ